ncbi:MAG: capsular polysaccharide export protein, LipB/KpsS family [Planctomycetota bacterium]
MNVLVFAPYAYFGHHFETDLEIIQRHLDQGDKVAMLVCNSRLVVCDPNSSHDFHRCWKCVSRRLQGTSLLSSRVTIRSFCMLTDRDCEELRSLKTRFTDIDDLKRLRVGGFDLGWAVSSSVISATRDPRVDLEAHADLVRDFVISGFAVHRSTHNYLAGRHIDRAYVFSGRVVPQRAFLRACREKGIDCFTHERGHDSRHYGLYENGAPHDRHYIADEVKRSWERASARPDREEVAADIYVKRSRGATLSWYSFVAGQSPGLLPDGWDPGKRNIAVFCSSEDEFAGLGDDWNNPLYDSQLAGLRRILDSLSGDGDSIHLYLRAHPNLAGVDNEYARALLGLCSPLLTMIAPEDPVSTYTLLKHADTVLTFGSTVGIEAVFWGRPSVLAGQSFWRDLGGTYNPASHDELVGLLRRDLKPKPKLAALMYGYYMATWGVPFRHYRATDPWRGAFRGTVVRGCKWLEWMPRVWRIPGIRDLLARLARRHARRFILNG